MQINPVTVSPAPMWAHRRILGQAGKGPAEQFSLFWRVNWGGTCGRWLSGNNSNQKISKLQACGGLLGNNSNKKIKLQVRVKIWRGLCGYNSNLVIKRHAGAVFPPLLSAGVIMPRGGAILSILTGAL